MHGDSVSLAAQIQARWSSAQGFSGLSFDPEHHTIHVFWQGPVPGPLLEQVGDAIQHAVEIRVTQARFSATQLQAEAKRLAGAFPIIRVISPRSNGDGLDVEVAPGAIASATARGVDLQALFRERVPVYLVGESNPQPL